MTPQYSTSRSTPAFKATRRSRASSNADFKSHRKATESGLAAKCAQAQLSAPGLDELYNDFELSQTRVTHLAQLHVAFIRHVGPYESVTDQLWQQLADWAKSKRLPDDLTFLGIAQDAPGLTAPERLRFDAGIVVPEEFSSEGAIGHQVLNAAEFAVTTHVGHYRTLPRGVRDYCSQDCATEKLSGWRSTLY